MSAINVSTKLHLLQGLHWFENVCDLENDCKILYLHQKNFFHIYW